MRKFSGGAVVALITIMGILSVALVSDAQPKDRSEIVIGAALPLTGDSSAKGRDIKWAYERAVNDVNSKGGIFVKDLGKKLKVKLVILNNESNVTKSAILVGKLINYDKVDLLLGGFESMTCMAEAMVAEKQNTYYHMAYGFPTSRWKEKNFKWSTNFFLLTKDLMVLPFEVLKTMDSQKRPKKMAVLAEETFAGKSMLKALSKTSKKYGYEQPLEATLKVGSTDYSQQISQLREGGADCAILFASMRDFETLMRQLKENKLNLPFTFAYKGAWSGKFWKDLGKDAQYILADGFWSMDYPFEGAKELGEEYHKTFGEYSITVGLPYALAQILFHAIEKAGTLNGAKVRAAVLSHEYNTVMGPVKYGEDGHAPVPVVGAQWWDGKQMLVYPSKYATWKVKLAPPWDKR